MLKIDKRIVIGITEETITERLHKFLNRSRNKGRGVETEHLRNWIITGFQLQELGGGVMDAWMSVERNGELDGLSKSEKASVLISMLERIADREPVKPGLLVEAQREPAQKPAQKPEIPAVLADINDMVQDYST